MRRKYKIWDNLEDKILRKCWGKMNYRRICELLSRNHDSIKNRARKIGLKTEGRRDNIQINNWESWKVDYLKRNYGKITCYKISQKISHSPSSVRWKASELGLKSNLDQSEITRVKIGKSIKYKIENDAVYRKKILLAPLRIKDRNKMTFPEELILNFIKMYKLDYIFSGNGAKIIQDTYCPDFIDENKKKIIEVNGDYWHNLKKVIVRDKKKLICYNRLGYKTLVVKEKDIYKNPQVIIERLISH